MLYTWCIFIHFISIHPAFINFLEIPICDLEAFFRTTELTELHFCNQKNFFPYLSVMSSSAVAVSHCITNLGVFIDFSDLKIFSP